MTNLNDFVSELRRDKARGEIAPHQIILLISFFHLSHSLKKGVFSIGEINMEFQRNWDLYCLQFKSRNNKVGMPLKALYNKGLIQLEIVDIINDFRNLNDLQSKISSVKLHKKLIHFLGIDDVHDFLISKINS
jgi:hypothetical protein